MFVSLVASGCSSGQSRPDGTVAPASDGPPAAEALAPASLGDAAPDSPADAPPGDSLPPADTRPADAPASDSPPGDAGPPADTVSAPEALPGANAVEAGVCTSHGPLPGCSPSAGPACDPVCQVRCGCGERCVLGPSGATCRGQAAPFLNLGDSCDPANDRCQPGHFCVADGTCGSRCARHCRADADCSDGATCSVEIAFSANGPIHKLCGSPPETCAPWGTARCAKPTQRPSPTYGCYLIGTSTNQTSCECAGTVKVGSPCTFQRECEPGAECVQHQGTRTCRKVCNAELVVGPDPGPCPTGQLCVPFPGSARYGFCN